MPQRKAASVLPEPVGAAMRTSRPVSDLGPARRLGVGGRLEAAPEPLGDDGMEARDEVAVPHEV